MFEALKSVDTLGRVHVERYQDRAVISYLPQGGVGWRGIELDDGAHEWPDCVLQNAACTHLGIKPDDAVRIQVCDMIRGYPPEGFFDGLGVFHRPWISDDGTQPAAN